MLKNILIVGGSSGLGLELAKNYSALGHTVLTTGRRNPGIPNFRFHKLAITANASQLIKDIN